MELNFSYSPSQSLVKFFGIATRRVSRYSEPAVAEKSVDETTSTSDRVARLPLWCTSIGFLVSTEVRHGRGGGDKTYVFFLTPVVKAPFTN